MTQETKQTERTLAIIKPDGVAKGLTIECIQRIEKEGLEIKEKLMIWMSREMAENLRRDIKERLPAIYESLIGYMTEGPSIALIIEGENASERLRKIIGATDPKKALKGTIRGDFAEGDMAELYKQGKVAKNIIHSTASKEEAEQEIKIIFGKNHTEHDAMKQPERDTKGGKG
jgi:nucleoside-diphosphate kinase